jgi:glycerol-3-phosphate O-acyltransferase/dihydroxyacetone phosphate acyltransferase
VFFHSILSIFFSSMEVIGKQNIPTHGPVIFTGNHMNQFVDGAVIVTTNPRRVGFLVAEKSMQKPLIGDFARACGSIAVARPQDKAKAGPGKIYFDNMRIIGEGTQFTKLEKGDKIRPAKSPDVYRIAQVISDTEGVLAQDMGDGSPLLERCQGEGKWCTYEIMGFVDQSKMFSKVHAALANGQCIGIFPEGGSHDNTDLLPLKVSACGKALLICHIFQHPLCQSLLHRRG